MTLNVESYFANHSGKFLNSKKLEEYTNNKLSSYALSGRLPREIRWW